MNRRYPAKILLLLLVLMPLVVWADCGDEAPDGGSGGKKIALNAFASGDYEEARRLFLPIAKDGDPEAQYYIGRMYEKGLGVGKDNAEIRKWYLRAAEGGHPKAQYKLAVGYAGGLAGLGRDEDEAGKWLRRSADNGYKKAQKVLSDAYRHGRFGFHRDPEQARMWRTRAENEE